MHDFAKMETILPDDFSQVQSNLLSGLTKMDFFSLFLMEIMVKPKPNQLSPDISRGMIIRFFSFKTNLYIVFK